MFLFIEKILNTSDNLTFIDDQRVVLLRINYVKTKLLDTYGSDRWQVSFLRTSTRSVGTSLITANECIKKAVLT